MGFLEFVSAFWHIIIGAVGSVFWMASLQFGMITNKKDIAEMKRDRNKDREEFREDWREFKTDVNNKLDKLETMLSQVIFKDKH